MLGQELGHYRILESLGAGGMGEVYRAEDLHLKRQVALKLLAPELTSDPDRLARFQRDAEALAALDHPNIVRIHGINADPDACYFIMSHVPGGSLAARLKKNPVSKSELMGIAKDMCSALEYAHSKGYVHRDLKPANILLVGDKTHWDARISDLGLAKNFEQAAQADTERFKRFFHAMLERGEPALGVSGLEDRSPVPVVDRLRCLPARLHSLLGPDDPPVQVQRLRRSQPSDHGAVN